MKNLRVLALSPHSDDLAMSVGGLLCEISKKTPIRAVTLFSESDWTHYDYHVDDKNISRIRFDEDKSYFDSLNVPFVSAGFQDAFKRGFKAEHLLNENYIIHAETERALYISVKDYIAQQINEFEPSLILCPAAVGGHIDHIITRQASIEAALMYGVEIFIYEDLPYAYREPKNDYMHHAVSTGATGTMYRKAMGFCCYLRKITGLSHYRSQLQAKSQLGFVMRALLHGRGLYCISERMCSYTNSLRAKKIAAFMGLRFDEANHAPTHLRKLKKIPL